MAEVIPLFPLPNVVLFPNVFIENGRFHGEKIVATIAERTA